MPPVTRRLTTGPCTGVAALLLLVCALFLAACGSPADDGGEAGGAAAPGATDGGAAGMSQAENDLRIDVDRGDGGAPESWTLVCAGSVEGTHPQARAACDHLAGMADPFALLPEDAMCTQQYGGPQTARITGRWAGDPVDLELSRRDGCRISRWDSLGPVLPVPVTGAEPLG